MDAETLKNHLHTELGIPLENIKDDAWIGGVRIEYIKPQQNPDSLTKHYVNCEVEIKGNIIKVIPGHHLNFRPTQYSEAGTYFNKRIRRILKQIHALVKEAQDKQDNYVYELNVFKSKHYDMLNKYGNHINLTNDLPVEARLTWFGYSYPVDLEAEEVTLGFGNRSHTIPIVAALDFLNECEVYKLLEG